MESGLHWNAEALWEQLLPLLPGLSIEIVERAASTNSALLERARVVDRPDPDSAEVLLHRSVESSAFGRRAADLQPCLLVAEHQTGGRGRQGRGWQSERGASLTFSLSLPLEVADWSGLSLCVGLALAEALDPAADGAAPRLALKWPNDLWLVDPAAPGGVGRKFGGVLIETIAAGTHRLAVIGVGLNVAPMAAPHELASGFGCVQELWPGATPPAVLARIAQPLVRALRRFEAEGFGGQVDAYTRRDLLRGRPLRTVAAEPIEGTGAGVDARGALLIDTAAGRVAVTSGEVGVRLGAAG